MSKQLSPYIRQFDGLRFVAILFVIMSHWLRLGLLPWGDIGVQLFFVLSGFLITGILLNCRTEAGTDHSNRFRSLRSFYARRFLRIFPLYYAVLLLCLIVGVSGVQKAFLWHAFYLSNFYISFGGEYGGYPINHFWSLSVEEQFYCIWPWLMLFLRERHLKYAILAFILCAPVSRWIIGFSDLPFGQMRLLPFASFDALGYGAWLAYLRWKAATRVSQVQNKLITWLAVTGLMLYLICNIFGIRGRYYHIAGNGFLAFALGWVVWRASTGFGTPVSWILSNPLAVYLGKISYGIYIFHNFAGLVFSKILTSLHAPSQFSEPYVRFPILVLGTVLCAAVSWHFFERPVNQLKSRFPYKQEPMTSRSQTD